MMNELKYRIVGTDGRTYGPASLEQIRQWLAEGRAESRTPVYVEGAADWTCIGQLPELAGALAASPPAIGAIRPVASPRGTNGFATAALVCALLSWTFCCCCGLPFNLLGLAFALVALLQIGTQVEPQEGRTLAIISLVLSALNLLFYLGYGIVSVVANPDSIHWSTSFQ